MLLFPVRIAFETPISTIVNYELAGKGKREPTDKTILRVG